MKGSTHDAYLSHLSSQFTAHADDRRFWEALGTYLTLLSCLLDLALDPVRDALAALYCPTGQGAPRDPVTMLRAWLLMTLCREGSPTVWARRLRREPVLAILAGFVPGDTPGASTLRDFLTRLADGPYAIRSAQDTTLSQRLAGRHRRRLSDATAARREAADAAGMQQSALLAAQLLAEPTPPFTPGELQSRLDALFFELGLTPTVTAELLPEELTAAGDGTVEVSAASKDGTRVCDCPAGSRCDCPREYLSASAQFCYDQQHGWRFGDRSYTISVHVNGHDVPLMTILPGGNESDFTLSLRALDRLLALLEAHELPLRITIFLGDGHHDALGIYRYLAEKGIVPIIPLRDTSTSPTAPAPDTAKTPPPPVEPGTPPRPQVAAYPHIDFEPDGCPLCPGGCRMRHETYNTAKAAHIYACPATRRTRAGEWHFYAEECPLHERCTPESKKMGLTHYLKSTADLRLFPPIPRESARFKALYAHRSGTERENASADGYQLDRRHRNAAFVLIRLTFVNIVKHARLRERERQRRGEAMAQMPEAMHQLLTPVTRPVLVMSR